MHYTADYNTAQKAPKVTDESGKEVFPVTISGKEYSERKDGGTAVKDAVRKNAMLKKL